MLQLVEQPINAENTVSVMSISESSKAIQNVVGVDENSNLYKALDPDAEVNFLLIFIYYFLSI